MRTILLGVVLTVGLAGCNSGPYNPPTAMPEFVDGPNNLQARLTYHPGARMEIHFGDTPVGLVMEYPSGKPSVTFEKVDGKTVKLIIHADKGTNARIPEREVTIDGTKILIEGP